MKVGTNRQSRSAFVWDDTLLIALVSMLDGKLFDSLEHIARDVRKDPRPIGGLQVCFSALRVNSHAET